MKITDKAKESSEIEDLLSRRIGMVESYIEKYKKLYKIK